MPIDERPVPSTERQEADLRLFAWHQASVGAMFWLPVSVLYLIDRVGLGQALRLQAIYYFAVVVAEVPTGWLSDRVGRTVMFRIVALAWAAAATLFLLDAGTAAIAAAQVLLAVGFASLSGTDVSYHLDALESLGRSDRFAEREAGIRRTMLLATAGAALVGGAAGTLDLRLPFALALAAALVQLVLASLLREPPTTAATGSVTIGPPGEGQGGRRGAIRRDGVAVRALGWLGLAMVVHVVTVHLVSELGVAYQLEVLDTASSSGPIAPLVNGILVAVVAIVGAVGVGWAVRVARRIGATTALVAAVSMSAVLIAVMAAVRSPWAVPLLVGRGLQGPVVTVLVGGAVGALVGSRRRATTLSVMGLAGRLTHGALLLGLGALAAGGADPLLLAAAAALTLVAILGVTSRLVPDVVRRVEHDHRHRHHPVVHDHLHDHADGHHNHRHEVEPVGPHRHAHAHEALQHTHPHTRDLHHGHDHRH